MIRQCPHCLRTYTAAKIAALPSRGICLGLDCVRCGCGDTMTRPITAAQSRELLRRVGHQIRKEG